MARHSSPDSLTGFVNLNKPTDMTSSDAVCIVRGVLSRRIGGRQKTGHLGTLDPLARGVLPIALGKATALFELLAFKRKRYTARFTFGKTTDTLDAGGAFLNENGRVPDAEEVQEALARFIGDIEQTPPAYSAKSVGGRRAYSYARSGETVELAPKTVSVYSLSLTQAEGDTFTFDIECGGGTYIRSLARDIADALGTCAYMSALTRTRSGAFRIEDAVTVEQFKASPETYVLPVETALEGMQTVFLTSDEARRILNGVPVETSLNEGERAIVKDPSGALLGIGTASARGTRLTIRL